MPGRAPRLGESDNMEWRSIPGFPDYEVSEYGHLRRVRAGRTRRAGWVLKGYINAHGYLCYKIMNAKREKVLAKAHRLVCLAFYGLPPDGREHVAHYDGNPLNNHYTNLRWASPKDNAEDAIRLGELRGTKNGRAKLTEEEVIEIRKEYRARQGKHGTVAFLARKYGLSHSAMLSVVKGDHWRHIHGW